MTDRLQHRHIHHQLGEESRSILKHRCSHGSLNSSTSSTGSSADPRPPPNSGETSSEPEHDALACLSCTRRNVISVFPRFRKVTTHLFSSFSRGHQSRASGGGGCPAESCLRAMGESAGGGDPHARDLPASQVYPAHPAGAALCLGKWGVRSAASAAIDNNNNNSIGSGSGSIGPADRVSHGDQFCIPLPTIPGCLARGCPLLKTTSRGAHTREFCLDIAQQRITWDSRKKKKLAHIDLERIVEIRIGVQALWAVANEDSLPHGAKRLFAIVYYHQMVLKTICVVALSDESYHEWLDTLTNLLSSRQLITSLAHYRRWRLVCIYRQWWEARQSCESATESLHFVENMMHSAAPAPRPAVLAKALPIGDGLGLADCIDDVAPRCSSPLKASARKWLSGGGVPIRPTPSLPLPMMTPPPMLGRAFEIPLKMQHSSTISLTSSSSPQSRCSDEAFMELVEALRQEHAQQSMDALYHDLSLSLTGFSSITTCSYQVPSLGVSDNDNESDAEDEDDEEGDRLTMAGGGNGLKRAYPLLRLEMPRSRTFGLTQPMFARFLREVQKELVTDAEASRRFAAFAHSGREIMTAYELEAYLLSAFNSVDYTPRSDTNTDGQQERPSSNMDMPLNQYYISTSHNTYLIGDQIVGTSKVEGYVRALLRGCRCIEVDCWDGSYGEPVVSHGHTLTTRILFEDVIIAVSQYAFAVSPYPVILSFETHCSLPQQARMATILKKHLGAMLVVSPVGHEQEYELPSPNQLKYRIIVKNKVLDPNGGTHSSRPSSLVGSLSSSAAGAVAAAAVISGSAIPLQLGVAKGVSPRSSVSQLKRKVAPELSELIVYCKAVHFEGLEEGSEMEAAFDRVTSVSESTSNQQIRQHVKKYIAYNATQMTRVYPAFSRVTSTNFNPIGHWAAGCQLVALNFQTHDRNMLMYEAMFRRTRDFGYVLKPKHLREPASKATPQAGEDGGDYNDSKASPASSSLPSSVSLQSSSTRDAGVSSPSSLARCMTVHINLLAAYNTTRGGPRRAAARVPGPMERRPSFGMEAGGFLRSSSWQMADPLSSSPKPLSRSPSDVAMFSFGNEVGSVAVPATMSDSDQLQQHLSGGYPSLNAVATAAMTSFAADHQKYAVTEQQGGSAAAGGVVRVEIEWITEGAVGSTTGGAGSSAEDVVMLASAISHLGHQQQLSGAGLSSIQSLGGTAPSSPITNPLGNGYPFHQTSFLSGSNVAATPKPAVPMPPPTFTPAGGPAAGRGGSGSGRFVSRNGVLAGNSEVRWKDETLFRIAPEPELSFARLSLFEDDVEVAFACVSVDSLKEGYRVIELGQDEKSRMCRPVYLLLHVQVSQLHCLATPPVARI